MKILVLSQYWYPENGVPQRRWAWLSRILIRNGHQVTVIAPPPHYQRKISLRQWLDQRSFRSAQHAEEGPAGERIIRSGFFPAGRSLTQRIFNQASVAASMVLMHLNPSHQVRKLRPDLVIGTVPALPTSAVTRLVAGIHRVPYVLDLRDAWPDLLRESRDWNSGTGRRTLREKILSRGPLQVLTKATEKTMYSALRKSVGVITTTQRESDYLANYFARTMPGPKPELTTIRNVFAPRSDYDRQVSTPREGGLNVLYAGTLGRAQKLENALEAAKIARDKGLDVHLRMIGDGATWFALNERAEELGLDVEFHHRLPADQLREYYEWADTALVHLTDWDALERAIPSKTYELMQLGIHISAAVAGEAASLIHQLRAGHVMEPENPEALAELWISLAKNPEMLQVGETGRKWVEHQRDEVVPANLLDILARIERNNAHLQRNRQNATR
ncbi:glycosyltransferase family 4 protein [Corynebacterium sp. 32222D000AT]|uniref:glycosyltransferase family 4 protein n=1 Tax=unclassified Corynebacterium TaxID=2624378 RepID=UPI002A98C510|nr:glycosyltransferase family 4 protein [Mycobacteriaceae bacterium]MDY5829686.1 glycosyltransferase family 4 protein [Corynebacterium sp.]